MSTVLPLPLELARPMELMSSLEDSLKETFKVADMKYNPETQVEETPEGVPMIYNHCGESESESNQRSESKSGLLVIDVTIDLQVDDFFQDN